MSATFLQKSRHQTVYYFRRKIPLDLRGRLGASPIFTTLHTRSRQHAVIVARRLDYRMHNKLVVVDNSISLIGGRNISDQYFPVDPK